MNEELVKNIINLWESFLNMIPTEYLKDYLDEFFKELDGVK